MRIVLNGDPADLPDGTSLTQLLLGAGLDPQRRGVALARNGEVVPRSLWATEALADGDVVELLTATQGG
jgi:sulfur carrier protein